METIKNMGEDYQENEEATYKSYDRKSRVLLGEGTFRWQDGIKCLLPDSQSIRVFVDDVEMNLNSETAVMESSEEVRPEVTSINCFCGKEHIDLRPNVKWMGQTSRTNCFDTCKKILESCGLHRNSAPNDNTKYQVATERPNLNGADTTDQAKYLEIHTKRAEEGLAYLNQQLEEGYPVVVGVDHTSGNIKNEGTTDHFIVIVGRGCDSCNVYYLFYEVGTGDELKGTSDKNKLYLGDDFSLSGKPDYKPYNKPTPTYFVTQIRKNIINA
jgi:hypothetical protein